MNLTKIKLNCPCCGNFTLDEIGVYEVCPLCCWEDDPIQSQDVEFAGGANKVSLKKARANWINNQRNGVNLN